VVKEHSFSIGDVLLVPLVPHDNSSLFAVFSRTATIAVRKKYALAGKR